MPEGGGIDHPGAVTVRLALVPAAVLALAACDNSIPGGQPDGPLKSDVPAMESGNSALASESGDLPPQGPGARFAGNWAVDEESCRSAAWSFTESTLRRPQGTSCSFDRVTPIDGAYEIQATCSADGEPTSENLKIAFEEGEKAMTIESQSIDKVRLEYCGRSA